MRAPVFAVLVSAAWGFRVSRRKVAAATCGAKGGNKTEPKIVKGNRADECEWKWQVGLTKGLGEMPFCGGMLVKEDWVLTSAQCVDDEDFQVVAGEWKPSEASGNEQVRSASQVYKHPSYNPRTSNNDFALVKLSSPFELNGCVGTVCLPTEDAPVGSTCWTTGWGSLNSGGKLPTYLQEGDVKLMSNAECGNTGYSAADLSDSMLCAQGKNWRGAVINACDGDTGGPLVCESGGVWSVQGVTSWGRGCSDKDFPGVWSRVFYVSYWIELTMTRTTTTTTTTIANAKPSEPPAEATCPSFAARRSPDRAGDCKCRGFMKCSRDGGRTWKCPTSGGPGGHMGYYFQFDCEDCRCHR